MGAQRGMFERRRSVPLLVHHSYSGNLLHYDLLVQYIDDGFVSTFRYRFTEAREVRVTAALNDAALEDARETRLGSEWAIDQEAPWGVPVNEIVSVTRMEHGAGDRVVIESTAQVLTIDFRDVLQDMVLPGYSAYAVAAYPGTIAE